MPFGRLWNDVHVVLLACIVHVIMCLEKKPSAFCSHIFVNSIMLNPMLGMFQPPSFVGSRFFLNINAIWGCFNPFKSRNSRSPFLWCNSFRKFCVLLLKLLVSDQTFAQILMGLPIEIPRDPHAVPPTNSLILSGKPPFFVDFHTKIWMFIQETSQPVCFNTAVRGIWRSSVGLGSIRASAAGFRLRSSWRIYPWSWKMCRPRCAWRRWKHMVPITSKNGYRTFMNTKRIQQISIYIYVYIYTLFLLEHSLVVCYSDLMCWSFCIFYCHVCIPQGHRMLLVGHWPTNRISGNSETWDLKIVI